jgi:hypothetical protein
MLACDDAKVVNLRRYNSPRGGYSQVNYGMRFGINVDLDGRFYRWARNGIVEYIEFTVDIYRGKGG